MKRITNREKNYGSESRKTSSDEFFGLPDGAEGLICEKMELGTGGVFGFVQIVVVVGGVPLLF